MAKCGISFEFIFRNIHAYIFSNTWQEILAILAILIRAKTWESAKSPKLPIWKWPNVRFRLNLFLGTWIHTYADTIFLTDKTQWALNEPLLSPQWAFTPNSMSFDANFTYNISNNTFELIKHIQLMSHHNPFGQTQKLLLSPF